MNTTLIEAVQLISFIINNSEKVFDYEI